MIDDIFGIRNDGILCRKGLADSVNEESFREELKKLKDKWNALEKKNISANMSGYSFFEWFKYYKADIMISSMIEAIRRENGLELLEMGNGDQYLAQFTTNGVESMNAELKRWVDSKLPIDQFINKLKMIVDAQENQYRDAT